MGHEFTEDLHAPYLRHDYEAQRRAAYRRIEIEEQMAQDLTKDGWTVYFPTTVCDRIGVRDGEVYFIEFKKGTQLLRPGQQAIHDLVPRMYKVIRHK